MKKTISNFPDGGLYFIGGKEEKLETEINNFIKETSPDIIISFGTDGYTKHLDHIAIGVMAHRIANNMKLRFLAIVPPPEEICLGLRVGIVSKAKEGVYAKDVEIILPNICFQLSDINVKIEVIKRHKTQPGIDPRTFLRDNEAKHILENEYFYER